MYDVLWTGGWDSTFRVLDLLMVKKSEVQPYYIIDSYRPSTVHEFKAMFRIRSKILELRPDLKLRNFITQFVDEITPNDKITSSFREIQKMGHIGPQYEWLARFAEERELTGLELGVERQSDPSLLWRSLDGNLKMIDKGDNDGAYMMTENYQGLFSDVFHRFHFPLFYNTKQHMKEYAEKHNFLDLLEHSWFCHTPILGDKPCGVCNPCKTSMRDNTRHMKITYTNKMIYILSKKSQKLLRKIV